MLAQSAEYLGQWRNVSVFRRRMDSGLVDWPEAQPISRHPVAVTTCLGPVHTTEG